jgi:hypothetical protein
LLTLTFIHSHFTDVSIDGQDESARDAAVAAAVAPVSTSMPWADKKTDADAAAAADADVAAVSDVDAAAADGAISTDGGDSNSNSNVDIAALSLAASLGDDHASTPQGHHPTNDDGEGMDDANVTGTMRNKAKTPVEWHWALVDVDGDKDDSTKKTTPTPTLVIAHEFFDALPIHQFQYTTDRGWCERLVDADVRKAAGPLDTAVAGNVSWLRMVDAHTYTCMHAHTHMPSLPLTLKLTLI